MSSGPSSKPEPDADAAACTRQALDLLARREHSRLELERKLERKGFATAVIAAVLDRLERSGALKDARFAESFVRARAARGQGPVRIRMELAERGADEAESAAILEEYDWNEIARAVRVKRFGEAPPKDYREKARQARFLEYRGFEHRQIVQALEVGADSD